MEVKAKVKHTRISPRKVRLVVDVVRGMRIEPALSQLRFLHKKASVPVRKLVESALANAEHNYELKKDNLYIKEIRVDEGRILHRWMPRAYGRATPIRKRTSHISVVLGEVVDSGEVAPKKQEIEAPVNLQQMAQKQDQEQKQEQKKEEGEKASTDKKQNTKKKETATGKKQTKSKTDSKQEEKSEEQDQEKTNKK